MVSVSDASNASAPNAVTNLTTAATVFWQFPEQISSVAKMALIPSVILVYMVAAAGNDPSTNAVVRVLTSTCDIWIFIDCEHLCEHGERLES